MTQSITNWLRFTDPSFAGVITFRTRDGRINRRYWGEYMHMCRECRMPTSGSICHRCRERRDNTCRRCSRRL